MDPPEGDFAARLAAIHPRLDHPDGVMLGVLRLPVLDPVLDELEAADVTLGAEVVEQLRRLVELLGTGMLGGAAESVPRRGRMLELLRRTDGGLLPAIAADLADPFGAELRAMLDSDRELRAALGKLHPLLMRATAVAPTARWLRDAGELAGGTERESLLLATRRVLAALVRAPVESRPDLLQGGLRPANQRLARGLLWYASVALPRPAATLGAVGLRMGTSGRSDAVARDVALANTAAALLADSDDPDASTALVSMRRAISNRSVLKQLDRAIATLATRTGQSVDELIDTSLPTFGLDASGRLELPAGEGVAVLTVAEGGVRVRWRSPSAPESEAPSAALATADPGGVATARDVASAVEAALAEERAAMEARLGSTRAWPEVAVRRRFIDHPIAGGFGRQLVWALDRRAAGASTLLATENGWLGVDEQAVHLGAGALLRPWHPADSGDAEIAAWRATLAARNVRQPFAQVDREVFRPATHAEPRTADTRFAGRIVDHARLRALLRSKGWAVPALGAWDQGDEATGWRAFDDGVRAELRYQAPERVATGERMPRARLVAVRFVTTSAPAAAPAAGATTTDVARVPARVFSEALRDVSLAVVLGELPRA